MLIVIYFSSILCTYVSLFLLLLSRHLTNSYLLPDYSFQEILARYKRSACLGAQIRPSPKDICALQWTIKSFSPDLGLCALLHKLPRFVKHLDSWQPAIVIPGRSTTWIPAIKAHFQGSQAFRSLTGQTWFPWTYIRWFGRYRFPRSGSTHSFGDPHFKRSCKRGSNCRGGNSDKPVQPNPAKEMV